ncbi:nucleotide cyclase [Dunaliella salina]|uniref:Nucleotide cyclase n=1 Tax=Dunaliella salina TaxID=3046 RepID=A0ABQ7GN83_DUNSA|nr:nucleotide cyclase [Dunaliella salina]|eukprot:KAF5836064.1 nucleotide cyclase [Dunaliella salina]
MDLATFHEEVTILFADIKGFTSMVNHLHPSQVMLFLDTLYSTWDSLVEPFGVYKIETIGDCYMAAAGLFCYDAATGTKRLGGYDPKHAETMLSFAKAMLESSKTIKTPLGDTVQVRVGMHCGSCSSGVVGKRMPRFCLFGDCVNTANRMESNGVPGCIHASHAALELLPEENWIPTGGIMAKGKGIMHTALLPVLPGAQHAAEVNIAERAQRGSHGGHGADSHALATPSVSSLTFDFASLGLGPLNHAAPSRSTTSMECSNMECSSILEEMDGNPATPAALCKRHTCSTSGTAASAGTATDQQTSSPVHSRHSCPSSTAAALQAALQEAHTSPGAPAAATKVAAAAAAAASATAGIQR